MSSFGGRVELRRTGRLQPALHAPPLDLRRPARQITFSCEIKFSPADLGERFE